MCALLTGVQTCALPIWSSKHWKSLVQNYRQAPHFEEVAMWLEPLYLNNTYSKLSELNRRFLVAICAYLDIGTTISSSADYKLVEGKTERLVEIGRAHV